MERVNPLVNVYKQLNSGLLQTTSEKMPLLIDIEVTNACNFNCLFCHTGLKIHKRKTGFMTKELYVKIIEEIAPYKIPLRFIRWGEPMLHPEFFEFLKIAKSHGLVCHFNTNGSFLNEETITKLLELKVDSVKYSFQGTDAKTYAEMRFGEDYNQLVHSVKLFFDKRGDLPYPYLHAATTITYETDEMVQAFKEELEPFCDLVTVGNTLLSHVDLQNEKLSPNLKSLLENKLADESLEKVYRKCNEIYDKLSIDWDGKVTACCGDYDNYMVVGDLNETTIGDIWKNSDRLKKFRDLLNQNKHHLLPLCKNCYDTMNLKQPTN